MQPDQLASNVVMGTKNLVQRLALLETLFFSLKRQIAKLSVNARPVILILLGASIPRTEWSTFFGASQA